MSFFGKLIRGIFIFIGLMLIGGFVFCSEQVVNVYKSFYGIFSIESLLCWLIAAFIAGLSFGLGKSRRREDDSEQE